MICSDPHERAAPATFETGQITAAILAGGEGARLGGRDKGLELLGGRPLVAHVIAALVVQAGRLLICANRNSEHYAAFAPVCADATPGFRGPLAGIAAALAACETDWLLTVPVDCPRMSADLARRLHAGAGCASAAVARVSRVEPLFALYRRELATEAAAALARDEPVWRWQQRIGAIEVDFADASEAFVNLNTPEDFRRWEANHG